MSFFGSFIKKERGGFKGYKALHNKGNRLKDLGQALDQEGKSKRAATVFQDAITLYDRAIKINSRDFNVWFDKAMALAFLNRVKDSLSCTEKALKLNPNHVPSLLHKGYILATVGRLKESTECFDKALKLDIRQYNIFVTEVMKLKH